MNKETIKRLQQLNKDFYSQRANDFSRTRKAAWFGWKKGWPIIFPSLPLKPRNLDLGCGTGRFGQFLIDNIDDQFDYTGVDESRELLREARIQFKEIKRLKFVHSRFEDFQGQPANAVVLFGVMHHIPGQINRQKQIVKLSKFILPNGFLIISFWQVEKQDNLIRRRARDQVIRSLGLDPTNLEPHDYLLPFGSKKNSWRYVHGFDQRETEKLGFLAQLKLVATFEADGKTGKINRYLIWQKELPTEQG